jgi:very-short-patch-repair endonuclease
MYDKMIRLENFLNDKGRVSSTKSTEKWVGRNFPEALKEIKNNTEKIGLEPRTFSEEIYHYINDLKSPVVCKGCGEKVTKFSGLLSGYLDYCSHVCSNSSDSVKKKKENSYLNKYGVDNPSKSKEIIEKIQRSFDLKYGGNPFAIKEFQIKIKETNLKKYGTEHPLNRESSLKSSMELELIKRFTEKYKHLEIIEFNTFKWGDVKIKCNNCNGVFSISKWNLHQRTKASSDTEICTLCNPIGSSKDTALQGFIRSYLNSKAIEFEEDERKILDGKEIDFYIKSLRIGIEVNGLYWHSDKFKHNTYHLEKTELASERGVELIQILEDEILETPELVKARLSSILGLNEIKVYARKCDVSEVDKTESSNFIKENHIQGNTGSEISLGLYHENQLMSIMTFGGLRRSLGSKSKERHWELIRFCSKLNTTIIGGASKLLNHFIETYKPSVIISYCDRRWSNGEFYKKLGLILESKTRPNYHYVKNGLRENRYKYRKDVLVSQGFDPNKSEREIMSERGFLRIYDCGTYRFRWETKKDQF